MSPIITRSSSGRLSARGCEGLPDFLKPERAAAAYEAATGHVVGDLDWYMAYAEFRQAITSIRISAREVHRRKVEPPDDPQDLIMERDHLEEVIAR